MHTIEQSIDHFNWAAPLGNAKKMTYQQRYFLYDKWWKPAKDGSPGPIFFYFGNEDNVELYVNHTGLMWENAEEFGALMVFAEHRYYGTSQIYDDGTEGCMNFLTSEQAMADFAYLIDYTRENMNAQTSPVIGFGGSYGGQCATLLCACLTCRGHSRCCPHDHTTTPADRPPPPLPAATNNTGTPAHSTLGLAARKQDIAQHVDVSVCFYRVVGVGMVGSWFRIHYPNAVDGVIAASAPIWSFSGKEGQCSLVQRVAILLQVYDTHTNRVMIAAKRTRARAHTFFCIAP